jgi:hypothetical protein
MSLHSQKHTVRDQLPVTALDQQVNEEWSFGQTLRHLVFITDAWASRTVLDEDRMAVMRRIVADLTNDSMGRLCQRLPAPGYPDEERTVIACIGVVMDEEIEHYRFATRDLEVLEAR